MAFWILFFTVLTIQTHCQQQKQQHLVSESDDREAFDEEHLNVTTDRGDVGDWQQQNGNDSVDTNVEAIAEMKKLRQKIEQMEHEMEELKENASLCENNHWNSEDCHSDLLLLKPDLLKVVCRGKEEFYRSVRAVFAQPQKSGIFYYEVKIVMAQRNYTRDIAIGLAPKSMPLNNTGVGKYNDTYAYFDDGFIYGHNIGGYGGNLNFEAGDVIGCGVDLARQEIIYTKNGRRLNTSNMLVHSVDLFPAVSLRNPGDIVEANFGPSFKYNMPVASLSARPISIKNLLVVMMMLGISILHDKFVGFHFDAI
uniref:B30.2/SPRY domain-containing protein n=1 Tax=Globodera rostochiensis TaxID=31243 RepID=A0A914GYG4_GLORO